MFVAILRRPRVLACDGHTVAHMSRIALVSLLAIVLAVVNAAPVAALQPWRPPLLDGALSAAFTFDRAAPYVRGARRGIDLRGVPGARVGAACAGVVTYAGRVPRWGRGVSLRCGGFVATELGLGSVSVGPGTRLWPGATVGRLAPRGLLRLGARRVGLRQGYVDPLGLLGRDDRSAPPMVAPRGAPAIRPRLRATPPVAPGVSRRVVTAVGPAATPHPAAVVAPRGAALSWPAWAGLALLVVGVGGGGAVRWPRRRRRRTGMALAQR
jgi:hypothetical protein